MFSSRLSLSTLIELCRSLRHYLGAGLSLVDVFRQQARRGPAALQPLAGRIASELEGGSSLEDALEREQRYFPPMMLSLASVGERSGSLAEVFRELERYFLRQKKLRNEFLARIAWPVIQFVLAVFVIALVIWILGQLNAVTPKGKPYDPLGLGLLGTSGAVIFLSIVAGLIGGGTLLYFLMSRLLAGRAATARTLLSLPAIGPCLQALALGRFCLALRLTTESGMSISKALALAMRATGNSAFAEAVPTARSTVRAGDDLTLALTRTHLFPDDLLRTIEVAEESGTLDAVLRHQGEHYEEEASRRLVTLTAVAGFGVWFMVGAFIIFVIFRFFTFYMGMLDEAAGLMP